eukprot:10984715-Alexandrium_andersonii.AAC.1
MEASREGRSRPRGGRRRSVGCGTRPAPGQLFRGVRTVQWGGRDCCAPALHGTIGQGSSCISIG